MTGGLGGDAVNKGKLCIGIFVNSEPKSQKFYLQLCHSRSDGMLKKTLSRFYLFI
jgi:hypothetical protein